MSFYGNFAAEASKQGAALMPVLEIDLNESRWNGTDWKMYLSSDAISARGKNYEARVVEGGWQAVTRRIDIRAAGLDSLSTSVTVADADGKVRAALLGEDQRNSPAAIYRVIPGNDSDYASIFTGLLDSWEFKPGQVILNLKTDERALRAFFPQWPYLKSEFFWMAQDKIGTYAPIVYGKHDSTNLGLDHGMCPSVPVWISSNWYAVAFAPITLIKNVYEDGALVSESNYLKVYGSYAGGKIFAIIEYSSNPPAEDVAVTADLYGYPWTTPSNYYDDNYTGQTVITNPVEQMRHFLINFAVDRTKGYIPGDWNDAADIIDGTSWNNAEDWATEHGLEGSRYLQTQQTANDVLREWLESFPMFRAFWNAEGKIELCVFSMDWPGYWDPGYASTNPLLRREDEVSTTFQYWLDSSDITGKISVQYLYDSVEQKFLRSLDVQDVAANVVADDAFDFYWSPARIQ